MAGEKNIAILLQSLEPVLNEGEYVFCTVDSMEGIALADVRLFFTEAEAITLLVTKITADRLQLPYHFVAAWITLTVHSALDAVGLTAAFSTALAKRGISCNVVAGYYHDHIFVATKDAQQAMQVLRHLQSP
jgi:uncharacterized protein